MFVTSDSEQEGRDDDACTIHGRMTSLTLMIDIVPGLAVFVTFDFRQRDANMFHS